MPSSLMVSALLVHSESLRADIYIFPLFHEIFNSEDDSTNSNSYDIIHFTKFFPLQHDAQSALE